MNHVENPASTYFEKREEHWDLLRFHKPIFPKTVYSVKIGWPAYAWRVVTPKIYDQKTDPLERLFLRLIKAGMTNDDDISRVLNISSSLAKYVLESCLSNGLVDSNLQLTSDGNKILTEGEPAHFDTVSLETGWIFRDGIRGEVIPMFFRGSLPITSRKAQKEVHSLPYNHDLRERPSMQSVVGALQRYQKLARYEQQQPDLMGMQADEFDPDFLEEVDWQEVADDAEPQKAQNTLPPRLVSISTQFPENVYLEITWYVVSDNPEQWAFRSPFGLAGGEWFRKQFYWALERDAKLQEKISTWKEEAEEVFSPSHKPVVENEEYEILRRFPLLQECESLHDTLKVFAQAYRAERLFDVEPENFDLVLTRYQKTLEALLTACIQQIPNKEEVARELRDDFVNKLKNLTNIISFEIPNCFQQGGFAGKVAASVLSSRVQKFQALRDRALFLLGTAYYDVNSQFRSALKNEPQLLNYIDLVADYRNKAGAHFDTSTEGIDKKQIVAEIKDAVHQVIQILACSFFEEVGDGKA